MDLTRVGLSVLIVCAALAAQQSGWHFRKDDPQTKKRVLTVEASSFEATKDPNVLRLHNMAARIYQSNGETFKEVKSEKAIVNLTSGTLTYGPRLSKNIKL
jgi:hypothetical protein